MEFPQVWKQEGPSNRENSRAAGGPEQRDCEAVGGVQPRVAWIPGGEVTGCPFQGQPGLLAAGGAAKGRDSAAIWLLPAPGAAAVPRSEAGYPGEEA
jgi:hypothetical protein